VVDRRPKQPELSGLYGIRASLFGNAWTEPNIGGWIETAGFGSSQGHDPGLDW
jgi:hypothetical protein